jgi:endonuclease YncB( thermonuclease family)
MRAVVIVCCALVWACPKRELEPVAEIATGDTVDVVDVVKGDELVVKKGKREAHIRLLGVHAFDAVMDDPVIDRLRLPVLEHVKAVKGKKVQVTLGKTSKDPHGRYLAYVGHDGHQLNRDLIAEGFVLVYTEYPFAREKDYLAAEAEARAAKKGIWADSVALKTLVGLRKLWREARAGAVDDPLLVGAPAE